MRKQIETMLNDLMDDDDQEMPKLYNFEQKQEIY